MQKSTKYKIYFSIWLLIISIALIFSPALRWNKNNEREITILNPKVDRHFPFKRNSKDKFVFINKADDARYPILCSSLKIDEKETFCDWYDGKNPEHKVYSIQKVSIVYLYSNWYKNRKIKKLSFMNEIEFLDKKKNIHHFVVGREKMNEQIKAYISREWGIILAVFILFFPQIFEWIFSGGDKERMKHDKNYEQLIALKQALVFIIVLIIVFIISMSLTSKIVNFIF
ncbi:MAG: hypothetical protein IKG79_00295 [Neisseriaceae bacterium]|nr:hypothetical protein [Neisseriaceae bacterium]